MPLLSSLFDIIKIVALSSNLNTMTAAMINFAISFLYIL